MFLWLCKNLNKNCAKRAAKMLPLRHHSRVQVAVLLLLLPSPGVDADQAQVGAHSFVYPGEVNIAIISGLHLSPSSPLCEDGRVQSDALHQIVAAHWAAQVINNQSLPHELRLGLQVHDTCGQDKLVGKHLYRVIAETRGNLQLPFSSSASAILGVIALDHSLPLRPVVGALNAFGIPIVASVEDADNNDLLHKFDNFFTTVPDISAMIKAVIELAKTMDLQALHLITSSQDVTNKVVLQAEKQSVRLKRVLELAQNNANNEDFGNNHEDYSNVKLFLEAMDKQERSAVAILLKDKFKVGQVAQIVSEIDDLNTQFIVATSDLDHIYFETELKAKFEQGLLIEQEQPQLKSFEIYFKNALKDKRHVLNPLLQELRDQKCVYNDICEIYDSSNRQGVSYVIKALSALIAAFRLVQLGKCSNNADSACLSTLSSTQDVHKSIKETLRRLSFASLDAQDNFEQVRNHFAANGRLVAGRLSVHQYSRNRAFLRRVGWYSEQGGLRLTHLLRFEDEEDRLNEVQDASPTLSSSSSLSSLSSSSSSSSPTSVRSGRSELVSSLSSRLESRLWLLFVLGTASFGILASFSMLVYVLQRVCDGTLVASQSLGILLLLSVLGLFVCAIPWTLGVDERVCEWRHLLHPLLLVLCFAVLLVKSMQLRALVQLGQGGSIPEINQMLSLAFIVAIQGVISAEWFLANGPIGVVDHLDSPVCDVSPINFMLLHLYPLTLLLLAFFYSVTVMNFKHNFSEGRLIAASLFFIIPIVLVWMTIYALAPVPMHEPSSAISITLVPMIVLALTLGPKLVSVARYGNNDAVDVNKAINSKGSKPMMPIMRTRAYWQEEPAVSQKSPKKMNNRRPKLDIYTYDTQSESDTRVRRAASLTSIRAARTTNRRVTNRPSALRGTRDKSSYNRRFEGSRKNFYYFGEPVHTELVRFEEKCDCCPEMRSRSLGRYSPPVKGDTMESRRSSRAASTTLIIAPEAHSGSDRAKRIYRKHRKH